MHDSPRPDITISMHDAAQQLAELGFNVFPLSPATKLPLTSAAKYPSERPRWGATRDPERIKNYFKKWPRANIGIETGVGFFIVEADTVEGHPDLKPGDGIAALDKLVADNGGWPETRKAISPTGSRHHYFRHPPGITIKASFKLEAGVEVLGYGNMAVAPPSIAPIAKGSKVLGRYRWLNNLRMAEAPPWLINLCKRDETERFASSSDDDEVDIDKACAALDAMPNDDFDEEKWYRLMGAAFVAGGGNIEVFDAFVRMSKRSSKHDDKRTRDRWRAFQRNPPRDIRAATLYWFADETAPGWRDRWHQKIMASVFAPLPDDAPSSPPPGSDAGPPPQQHKAAAASAAPDSNADPVDLWGKFDPPELPTGLLPVVIERYARIEGANMGCDPAGLAMSALTVCAAAITDTIKLQPKEHDELWTEAARIWAALVGHPSTKKTPTLNQAAWPAAKLDRKMIAQYLEEKETYDALSAADKKRGPPPRQSRLKVEDTTVEAAQEVLKDSPAGVLCLQDELSGFFGAIDKYAGGRGSSADRAFWMKAYNGGPSTFHRISRGSGLIPNLSVCLLGGIQPDAIRKVAADTLDDGLLQRMLFIVLRPATAGQDKPRDPVVNDYFKLVDKLHRMEPPQQPGFNDNKTEDTVLRFDQGAQEIRNQLVNRHIDLVSAIESVNNKLATHVGKYDGVFARLCVLWHCIENADLTNPPAVVTEDTARRVATFLHDFIFRHAATFYFGTLGLADNHDRLANVAGFILARGLDRITNRDVQRGDRSMRKLTDWDTLKLFEQLEALGWVERRLPKRAPEKMQWIVNPQVHVRFADRAKREADRRADAREALAGVFAVQKG